MISFNSTCVVGGRVKLCLNHPKQGGNYSMGYVGYFFGVTSIPYFSVPSTLVPWGTWGHRGSPPCSCGYWLLGQFPAGVAVGQGPDVRGGGV